MRSTIYPAAPRPETQTPTSLYLARWALHKTHPVCDSLTLKTWNDELAFGFIEPAQGGQEIFVHIKDFPPGTGRPSVGQTMTFEVQTKSDGKKKARAVQYPVRARQGHRPRVEVSLRHGPCPAPLQSQYS